MRQETQYRRRRAIALTAVAAVAIGGAALAIAAGGGGEPGADANGKSARSPEARRSALVQLPGGGRRLFPDRRIVAFYGNPRARELGALGIGSPSAMAKRLIRQARPYDRKSRRVLPAMELIVTLATAAPGAGNLHRARMPFSMIRRYLRAARRAGALLVLDIQPGRARFGPEIEHLARWLREPDVGLALDPEWHVGADEVPGRVIGSMDADAVNAAAAYLSRIVRERGLPEKLLLVHRFTNDMIARDERLRQYPGVRTVINVDGFGGQAVKIGKYKAFVARTQGTGRGFKLFYDEDSGLMRPAQVMKLQPRPDVVVYE